MPISFLTTALLIVSVITNVSGLPDLYGRL